MSAGQRDKLVCKDTIEREFEQSGERDRIREVLTLRLTETGWTSAVDQQCRKLIGERGIDNITLEEVVGTVSQDARRSVPEDVKMEVVQAIQKYLERYMGTSRL